MSDPDDNRRATSPRAASSHLPQAVARLRAAGVADPVGDARRLMAYALGIAPDRLTLHLPDPMADAAAARFATLIDARASRRPVSHLIGTRLFWGRAFRVTGDVLDPRPETEALIALALAEPAVRLLDLGTGSGAIVLTLLAEMPGMTGVAVDVSAAALAVAELNAVALRLTDRVAFVRSDWWDAVSGRYDLIVSNPPYVADSEMAALSPEVRQWEPRMALVPAQDDGTGLTAYRQIAQGALAHLSPAGRLIVEVGPTQGAAVVAIFRAAGLTDVTVRPDMDGRDRVVMARAPA